MKKLFIVANWKSHKTVSQGHEFLISFFHKDLSTWLHGETGLNKHIIFCPPFTLLSNMKEALLAFEHRNIKVSLGAQDISPFPEGPHTGEESIEQLKDLVTFVIIGHSERRQEFGETDESLAEKVALALAGGIEPIFCVQGKETPVPDGVRIVAYEPIDAIGTGRAAATEDIEEIAAFYKREKAIHYVLYGGSVNADNVREMTSLSSVDGVLVGGASLDPDDFSQIVMRS